uniref:PilZ domain-containing protein n=1 Tax=Geobacter metallireducens TaxID=28232 RepID=A0A831UBW5_GEOME
MKEEFSDYQLYFGAGMRVEVRFPRGEEEPFRDDAVISLMVEDLVKLQLSREVLPHNVKADTGATIGIRGGKEGSAHRCSAMIVEDWDGTLLTARLIGTVVPDEMREYYRIETYIPLRYRLDTGASAEQIREQWHARRYPSPGAPKQSSFLVPETVPSEEPVITAPLAANLSGSGIRIRIHEELPAGTLLPMDLYLQLDSLKTVPIVGEVVQVSPLHTREADAPLFSTALRFVCIDERDRDAVIKFISREQLARLRVHLGGNRSIESLDYESCSRRRILQHRRIVVGIVLLFAAIAAVLVFFRLNGPKGEIEQTFEREMQKYRELFPWR